MIQTFSLYLIILVFDPVFLCLLGLTVRSYSLVMGPWFFRIQFGSRVLYPLSLTLLYVSKVITKQYFQIKPHSHVLAPGQEMIFLLLFHSLIPNVSLFSFIFGGSQDHDYCYQLDLENCFRDAFMVCLHSK